MKKIKQEIKDILWDGIMKNGSSIDKMTESILSLLENNLTDLKMQIATIRFSQEQLVKLDNIFQEFESGEE